MVKVVKSMYPLFSCTEWETAARTTWSQSNPSYPQSLLSVINRWRQERCMYPTAIGEMKIMMIFYADSDCSSQGHIKTPLPSRLYGNAAASCYCFINCQLRRREWALVPILYVLNFDVETEKQLSRHTCSLTEFDHLETNEVVYEYT